MEERIVTRHLGRSTWQGPESEAPDALLPIDLPAIDHGLDPTPMQMLRARDVIYAVICCLGTVAGGAFVLWVMP